LGVYELYEVLNEKLQATTVAMTAALKAARDTVSGAPVVSFPVLWLNPVAFAQEKRSFPRNVSNSQPSASVFVYPQPGRDKTKEDPTRDRHYQENIFETAWKAILEQQGTAASPETNTEAAWRGGGEVHCVSNAIREPLVP